VGIADVDAEPSPSFSSVVTLSNELVRWLRKDALPLWDKYGVDRNSGGYFESLRYMSSTDDFEVFGKVRRGRVIARQMFAFDVGHRLGWQSMHSNPVHHGCEYLFSRMYKRDGLFHSSLEAETRQPHSSFSLYEYAFYLFALARVKATLSEHFPVEATATWCLKQLRRNWGKSIGGFEESDPPSVPLKSNPHMHMLEAALAWIEAAVDSDTSPWVELARETVDLCLIHFIDPDTGAVREYFDAHWCAFAGEIGRIVEPGHQFEWAWLLMRWAESGHCNDEHRQRCLTAAQRLIDVGERWGVDAARGVAFNELWDDMTIRDSAAKLWPQTERVKAWCAMLEQARTSQEAELALKKITLAIRGMLRYFLVQPAGLWQEVLLADGEFTLEPCKASSFYHIVCAIETLQQTLSACSNTMLY
jgi:mannose/cellobiose epimerase-like protein (N-acyl-D-glucosamine 2-epimerase family)